MGNTAGTNRPSKRTFTEPLDANGSKVLGVHNQVAAGLLSTAARGWG